MMKQTTTRLLVAVALSALAAAPALGAEGGESNIFAGDIGNAIWTLVIFGLVLFVLGKYAWGPMLERLQAREDFIRDALTSAKADREAAEKQLASYEQKLAAARAEATALVEEGRRDAAVVRQRIEEEARAEAEKIVARARKEIEIAKDTAVKELYTQAAHLATQAAAQIISKELDPADHQRLIAEAIERMESAHQN
jgi:F-type H+-transporting ATPase subunit b